MLDASQIFSGSAPATGQAITATAVSTNVLDLLAGRDIGAGNNNGMGQQLHCQVITAFDNGATPTLQIAVQAAPDNGSGSPGTYYDLLFSPVLTGAQLIVGARVFRVAWPDIQLKFPAGDTNPMRFLRLNYTVASGPFTTGSILAYLAAEREERLIYPNNYTSA